MSAIMRARILGQELPAFELHPRYDLLRNGVPIQKPIVCPCILNESRI